MTELPMIFEGAKVGDDVFTAREGWLKIQEVEGCDIMLKDLWWWDILFEFYTAK